MPFQELPEGQTHSCDHETTNESGICDDCLGGDPKVDEHEWHFHCNTFSRVFDDYQSCKKCGIIRRADNQNKPCKGVCKIALREEPKPLSFSEPLTKEAVGRMIYHPHIDNKKIENISIDGEWAYVVEPEYISECDRWRPREHLRIDGWSFDEPTEITIKQAEKLTGKKIKR